MRFDSCCQRKERTAFTENLRVEKVVKSGIGGENGAFTRAACGGLLSGRAVHRRARVPAREGPTLPADL